MTAPTAPAARHETASSARFSWRIIRGDPAPWFIALALWIGFYLLPLPAGLALRAVLDRIAEPDPSGLWTLVAVLAGLEVARWGLLLPAILQWHGAFVRWHTVSRLNILRSLTSDPGPVSDRLPGSPGEAVSRFRDDSRSIAEVLDVWLDVVAAAIATGIAMVVLLIISPAAALAMTIPIAVILWVGHALGDRLRAWRLAERQATARVTGFIGDTFGAVSAVKVGAAEPAILARFAALGAARAEVARRDQVGTQLAQVLGGITSNAGLGLALVVVAPAISRGELTTGDIALFTTYAGVVASLPRVSARWSAWQRQGDVSAARLGRLMADREPDSASQPVDTHLRHGPPAFERTSVTARTDRSDDHRLGALSVRGLTVHLDDTDQVSEVDLDIRRGQLVVITGTVGAGKSVLLRALLGLIPTAAGTITWNETTVHDPSTWFVPPRAAYVPQVPRLFSESLADTVLLGVDDRHLAEAFDLARLKDDLVDLPGGADARVGPKGVRLSGGQIQRTAAARAFVRAPELLVVDDLSSALDGETETALWDGLLGGPNGDLTVLAVSHRPRVLERADQVIELHAGGRIS